MLKTDHTAIALSLTGPPLSESISHAKHSYVSNILAGQVRTAEVRRLEAKEKLHAGKRLPIYPILFLVLKWTCSIFFCFAVLSKKVQSRRSSMLLFLSDGRGSLVPKSTSVQQEGRCRARQGLDFLMVCFAYVSNPLVDDFKSNWLQFAVKKQEKNLQSSNQRT